MALEKLKHFCHPCPLTSSETVSDGICNICFQDEPVEFACKDCNFELCKSCSKLPQKVSHDFHPEHPLEFYLFQFDRKPGKIICSGCGNMSSCSFYECMKCEIYLDIGCALLKNITTCWDAREMLHNSHEHLLRRCRPGEDSRRGSCLLCELPLSPSSICYGCIYCYSFLHERCLNLPTEICYTLHSEHTLKRFNYMITCKNRLSCDACGDGFENVPFGCQECQFFIHLRCVDSSLRGLLHESHEHRLLYVPWNKKNIRYDEEYGIYRFKANTSLAEDDLCQICMKTGVRLLDSYFYCIECDSDFHFECIRIPKSIFKRSYHVHPLVCNRLPVEDDSLEYCGVCETVVDAGHHVYSCQECDFVSHIGCILNEEKPSPFYLKDLFKSCGENVTRATNQEDDETNGSENKLMVNEGYHDHVMRSIDMCELGDNIDCAICYREVPGNPWKCETCDFVSHSFCAELGKQSVHRFHVNHPLTLMPGVNAWDSSHCDSCGEIIDSFNLLCRICSFVIHVTCALKSTRFLGMDGLKVVGVWRGRCLENHKEMVQVMFSKSHQMVCDICDEKVFGKVVSCMDCEKVYHPQCIVRQRSEDILGDSPASSPSYEEEPYY